MSVLQPLVGKLTFESEGAEGGPFHSRVLHVPSGVSGLTIGRGYDLKMKSAVRVQQDLVAAGLRPQDAALLSRACGLAGPAAKAFITSNRLDKFEITQQQQVKLFEIVYKIEEAETMRLCTKPDVVAKYGKCNWTLLDSAIKQILVDLKFRGDYTGDTRKFLQRHVVANDTTGFLAELSTRSNWLRLRVPQDRFQRRIAFFRTHAVFKPQAQAVGAKP